MECGRPQRKRRAPRPSSPFSHFHCHRFGNFEEVFVRRIFIIIEFFSRFRNADYPGFSIFDFNVLAGVYRHPILMGFYLPSLPFPRSSGVKYAVLLFCLDPAVTDPEPTNVLYCPLTVGVSASILPCNC